MISITPKDDSFTLQIGKHPFVMSREMLESIAAILEKDRITEMAELLNPWSYGDWILEGASEERHRDPQTKWEYRKRLLLRIGNQKWHLTQQECLKLGFQCQNLLQGK
jgi:hypothetical protein